MHDNLFRRFVKFCAAWPMVPAKLQDMAGSVTLAVRILWDFEAKVPEALELLDRIVEQTASMTDLVRLVRQLLDEALLVKDNVSDVYKKLTHVHESVGELIRWNERAYPVTVTVMGKTVPLYTGPAKRETSSSQQDSYLVQLATDPQRPIVIFMAKTALLLPSQRYQFSFPVQRPLAEGVVWVNGPARITRLLVGNEISGPMNNEPAGQVGLMHRMVQIGETLAVDVEVFGQPDLRGL